MICAICTAENPTGVEQCGGCGAPLSGTPGLKRGAVIANRYELLTLLGRGGMGVVFKAHDRLLDETVAIKVVRGERAVTADAVARFRGEIKLARRVTHRNVCRIHEYGEDGGLRYISMAFIDGTDLKTALREMGGLTPQEALDTAICVAEAVAAIHAEGIVHRDLKTSNIMLDRSGVMRLMDFGLAKESQTDAPGLTVAGQILGTPEYMSPEQAQGLPVDFRTDIYALGVIVFELFTGRVPFRATAPWATLMEQVHKPPPLEGPQAAGIPPALVAILRQALAKNSGERFESAAAMADALRAARDADQQAQAVTVSKPADQWTDPEARAASDLWARAHRVGVLQRRQFLLVGTQLLLVASMFVIDTQQEYSTWLGLFAVGFLATAFGLLIVIPVTTYSLMKQVGAPVAPLWALAVVIPCTNVLVVAAASLVVERWCHKVGIPGGFFGPSKENLATAKEV